MLRGYFCAFALYYVVMLPTHLIYYSGLDKLKMGALCSLAAAFGLVCAWVLRKPTTPMRTAIMLLTMNVLVVANVVASLSIEMQPAKLTYFIIMVMVFGLASISLRQSLLSISMALTAMLFFLPKVDPATYLVYAFLTFAAALASLAIACTGPGGSAGRICTLRTAAATSVSPVARTSAAPPAVPTHTDRPSSPGTVANAVTLMDGMRSVTDAIWPSRRTSQTLPSVVPTQNRPFEAGAMAIASTMA